MSFLVHLQLAARDLGSPTAGAGAMLGVAAMDAADLARLAAEALLLLRAPAAVERILDTARDAKP